MKNLKALLLVISSILFTGSLSAANRYWIATTTANWNSTLNWSTTSGGAGGASVPGSSDVAIFNAAKVGSCTINANVNVLGFSIVSGYTGTISQGANTVTVGTTGYSQAAGTFSGGSVAFAANLFTLSGGTFTATSANMTTGTIVGNATIFTHSGGTFNHNNGTVVFACNSSTSTYTVDVITGTLFYKVIANGGTSLSFNSTLQTAANDTVKAANDFTHGASAIKGNWRTQGNLIINTLANGGTGNIILYGTGNKTYTYSTGRTCNLVINKSSGTISQAIGTTDLSVQGFKLLAGTFTAPSTNFYIGGTFTANATVYDHTAGTFTHNNGTTIFDMNATYTFTIKTLSGTIFNHATINSKGPIVLQNSTDTLRINSNLNVTGGTFNTGLILVKGNLTITNTFGGTGKIAFMGTTDQNFTLTGATDKFNVTNLIIKQSSGKKVVLQSAAILDQSGQSITFTRGNIVSTATNLLTLGNGVTVSGMSNNSYVDGPMKKVGNAAFTFPVGKYGIYRKISISAPSVTTDAYTAEFFPNNSDWLYSHTSKDATLNQISRNEYWNLTRNVGTSNISVTLSWDTTSTSCTFASTANLKVANWNGTLWKDKGNGGVTGNIGSGTIVTSGATTTYGTFVLGSSSTFNCVFAVNEIGHCGSYYHANPDTGMNVLADNVGPYHFFDGYGNKYNIQELEVDTIATSEGEEINQRGSCASGYFNLIYEQNWHGGFLSPAQRLLAQDVICQVYTDLSEFINPVDAGVPVNILIRNMAGIPGVPPNVLGLATPIYCVANNVGNNDIIDNQIWRTINSGVDAYTGVTQPFYNIGAFQTPLNLGYFHGIMSINFNVFQVQWQLLLDDPTFTEYDLYSIVLHEATHMLGFISQIDCDGTSNMADPFNNPYDYYSRYDKFLENVNDIPLITNTGSCNYFEYTFNSPTLNAPSLLSNADQDCVINNGSCATDASNCATAVRFGGVSNLDEPVYTPNCYESGSTLSHLEDQCNHTNNLYYVMAERIGPGIMRRSYQQEEKTIFCELGYSVNTSFGHAENLNNHSYTGGACEGIPVVGVHDGIDPNGVITFITTPGDYIEITATATNAILNNDYNADNYVCPEIQVGDGSLSIINSTTFRYTPNTLLGPHILKYIPRNGTTQGSLTYIYVYVMKDETCCEDDCNMVSNGEFEDLISTPACTEGSYSTIDNMSCWYRVSSTPDILSRDCSSGNYDIPTTLSNPASDTWNNGTNNNDHFISLFYRHSGPFYFWTDNEAVQTNLCNPIEEGHSYKISLWVKVANYYYNQPSGLGPLQIAGTTGLLAPTPTYNSSNVSILHNEVIPNDNAWHHVVFTYTHQDPNDINVLILAVNSQLTSSTGLLYIDDVKVVDVEECCTPSVTLTNATWSGGSTLGGLSVYPANTITDQTFKISGTLTIDYGDDLIFDNCDIYMDTDADIYVSEGVSQTGGSLTVTNNTHIHSCDDMWDMIFAPNGAELFINNESLIEDAEYGAYVQDGTNYQIDGAIFNKNWYHVAVLYPATHQEFPSGYITNNKFLCQTTASIGTGSPVFTNLLYPRDTQKTGVGVYVLGEIIEHITIGTIGNGNYFQNATYGIMGIDGINDVKVIDNEMNDIDETGIFMYETKDTDGTDKLMDISDNILNRMITGIYCYDNVQTKVKIKGNTIDFAGMADPQDEMFGIVVEEITYPAGGFPNRVSITENNIYNAPTGIWTTTLLGDIAGGSGSVYIGNNTVTHTKPNNDYQAGILFENCTEILVIDNEVYNPTLAVNSHEVGIRQELGSNNYLFCNDVHDIGKGIYIYGVSSSERLVKNKMQNTTTGLYLHNSVIGAQGTTSNPHDNEWNGAWTGSNYTTHLFGSLSVASGSIFTVQNVTQFKPVNNFNSSGALFPLTWNSTATQPSTDGACPIYIAPAYKTEDESQVLKIKNLLGNKTFLSTDIDSSVQWMGDYGTYRMLNTYSYLKNVDPQVDEFYERNTTTNTGKLERAISKTHSISKAEAGIYLDSIHSIIPTNKVELRLKQVLEIMYSDIKDSVRLNPVYVPVLREIAKLCPYTDGFGVYVARALLHKVDTLHFPVYKNECERVPDVSEKMEDLFTTIQTNEGLLKVYPNPANNSLTIEYIGSDALFEMYDVHGKNVKFIPLKEGKRIISTEDLFSGVYYYLLREGEITKYRGKQIIIR